MIGDLSDGIKNGSGNLSTKINCTNVDCLSDEDYMEYIETYIFPSVFEWFLIALSSIIFIVGTTGNLLVITSVVRNPSMSQSVTNHFIVNLSIADFLVLIICLPPTILWDVTETWFLGSAMCRAVLFCQRVCIGVSVMTFLCIAVDRWCAVVIPLKFASTAFRAKIAVLFTWILASVFPVPELLYLDLKPSFLPFPSIYFTQCVAHWTDAQELSYQIFVLHVFYLIPICPIIVLYGMIVYTLWWRALPPFTGTGGPRNAAEQAVPNGSASLKPGGFRGGSLYNSGMSALSSTTPHSGSTHTFADNQIKSRRKVAKMLIVTVAIFAFCYLPVHALNLLRSTVGLPNTELWVTLSLLGHWIGYMQNASNPIIYYVMSEKFRREFNRIFRCCAIPRRPIRRNSSEVFRYDKDNRPAYFHTLGLSTRANSCSQRNKRNAHSIVQL